MMRVSKSLPNCRFDSVCWAEWGRRFGVWRSSRDAMRNSRVECERGSWKCCRHRRRVVWPSLLAHRPFERGCPDCTRLGSILPICCLPRHSLFCPNIDDQRGEELGSVVVFSFDVVLPRCIHRQVVISSFGVVNVDSCRIQKTTLSQPFLVSTHSSHTISNTSFLSSTFTSSAFVLSACHSLSIEPTTVTNITFESSFLVGTSSQIATLDLTVSNNTLKQNSSLFALSIIPKTTSADTPSIHISSSSFSSSPTTPTPLFVSVASDCALNVVVVYSTFSHSSSSQNRTRAVVVKWTTRQPLLLRRRVVCEDCFVLVSQSL
ncbi:hypothetical protein BLNAU_21247 [Blattamonas nauphoetae]|uniref:Uncharacterized protein n=1 Tax=Blattamonas nauphoetae TaxID=2049346 RepID=A0ABQ9WXF5_9EUKA|nr:hypothetical protein BLNAU_21247 [Blattamonas nauphoetae]